MRVCFLAPELLPNQGGVGTYSVELIRQLASKVDLTVLTLQRSNGSRVYDRPALERYFDHGVRIEVISEAHDTFLYNQAFQRAVRRRLPDLVRTDGVDLIHSQHAHMPDLLVRPKPGGPPTLRTMHSTILGQRHGIRIAEHLGEGMEPAERWQKILGPLLRTAEWSILQRHQDTYIAVSRWMQRRLAQRGILQNRSHVIHCGVDPERFRPDFRDEQLLARRPGQRLVLFPGRPTIVKGAGVLAHAMPEILRRAPETEFVLTGAEPDAFLRLMNLPPHVRDSIRFLGYIPYPDLPRVFASCDLMVAPTYYENFPIRILEAMASGLPVVASDVGGISEAVISGVTGALVSPGDPSELAEAVVRLVQDDSLRASLGQQARRLVCEQYTWARAATLTHDLYARLSGHGRTPAESPADDGTHTGPVPAALRVS